VREFVQEGRTVGAWEQADEATNGIEGAERLVVALR